MRCVFLVVVVALVPAHPVRAADPPLFAYLTGSPVPTLVTYTPSELDPRQDGNHRRLKTSSLRADLESLRPAFDGLVLYAYHESTTPRLLALAKELKFRAVILGIWEPRSANEIDGVAELARLHQKDFALGVLIGNEGLTFKRYEIDDLKFAMTRLLAKLPSDIPVSTSEPLVGYKDEFVRSYGDFAMPNIHPVFDRKELPPAEAAAWAREQAMALARQVTKPVVLKETGFPHAGKETYTPESQKLFWEAYTKPGLSVSVAGQPGVWVSFAVAFEAFDLPWKAEESKLAIEKSWGLRSPKREPHPAFDVWRALRK